MNRDRKKRAFEEKLYQLYTDINRHVPNGVNESSEIKAISLSPSELQAKTLRDLLDFHRRANKPQWWAVFDRQAKSFEERIEDVDCVAGAVLAAEYPVTPEARSLRYTYRYPAQEVKLKSGDKPVLVDTLEGITDFTIDHEQQLLTFKLGKQRALPLGPIDIGAGKPIDPEVLQTALFRYAADFLATKNGSQSRYPAISALLRRDFPAVLDIASGRPLLPAHPSTADIISLITRLDKSTIFIQGPPGAGKTYTASHVIIALLKGGKRIGVSSNSHKAIVNLLQGVEAAAKDSGFKFVGVKKSDPIDPGQLVNGDCIADIKDKQDVINANAQLIGGTAWLFADPALDQTLDYLFVDEAGQVALGMLVPMATSTRNIVLLGDQMQLAQPVEGVHPGESGASVLDYLLQGQATIPPEQGIFLENSWRMHPDICRFISAAIYNGRLASHPKTEKRKLVLTDDADSALKPTGIHVEPIDHEGCSQESEEEATRIKKIYQSLLEQHFIDENDIQRKITKDNVLVVSPYNMQVNLLKQHLGIEARVGTVDKFQGQEAEVVIISMATSSGDEMPRNIDFLFSKNRLNVAISRAKCLAILVINPNLLSVNCRTPDEIALVNTLCWVWREYGQVALNLSD